MQKQLLGIDIFLKKMNVFPPRHIKPSGKGLRLKLQPSLIITASTAVSPTVLLKLEAVNHQLKLTGCTTAWDRESWKA